MQPAAKIKVGNLPHELTSFVGRRREIAEARGLLATSRLVTLTGIGGVGKTRLALRVALDSSRAFEDGVWLVELGELEEDALVVGAVVAALKLREQQSEAPEVVLREFLEPRCALLVLDNCEHLVDAVAGLTEFLLRSCPELRILATSREPLGIPGEATVRVPPLTLPHSGHPASVKALAQYESVALFAERAAAAVPGFHLTEDNRVAVVQICQQLDGLPLAIELAAVRLRVMSVEQILQRLTDRYQLLTTGCRGAPARQQTLLWCIDWSHELCTPQERELWGRLAVFAGGFELDAVEKICSGSLRPAEVVDVVASLIDKSILIREEARGAVRYRLLETLREYGREKLQETSEFASLLRRHRNFYEQLAVQARSEWVSARQVRWIQRLDAEQPNLRAALHFCLTSPKEAAAGLRMAAALYPFWRSRGLLREGRRWVDQLLAVRGAGSAEERIRALYVAVMLSELNSEVEASSAAIEEAHTLAQGVADPISHALIAHAEGGRAMFGGHLDAARANYEAALAVFRTDDNLLHLIWGLLGLALATGSTDPDRSAQCQSEILALTEAHGESVYRSWSLWAAGMSAWQHRDFEGAEGLLKQGLQLAGMVDDRISAAGCLEVLGWIAVGRGDSHHAAELMGAAHALAHAVGNPNTVYPNQRIHHLDCAEQARRDIGDRAFEAAFHQGMNTCLEEAAAAVLGTKQRTNPNTDQSQTALTRREWQVAELVADGLTNKAIAATLVISQRTAQGHVEHILAKLGFTSRTQIAAWVVEHAQDRHV
ncbi:LuxR family transcriptional regulator [Rhodococcus oxybenzonivorans]|uniref:LuxR family transcriptional regulator n=1 Tax=Rhodococcus oxybenzonivorans TaxID=1990687 RepID=A0A2S2BVD6_9NOCA|nr:LuxR C-terminal-related transcriptional regulator [Rhodococcus oxybenzonivorans]AWK72597.1 LuxR family transcriptional regulator [Rhodococcus oxybenzonivorans]